VKPDERGDPMSPLRRTTKSAQELRDRLLALADRAGLAQRSAGMTADQFHRFASTGQNREGDSETARRALQTASSAEF
jgi:hypothetical protein